MFYFLKHSLQFPTDKTLDTVRCSKRLIWGNCRKIKRGRHRCKKKLLKRLVITKKNETGPKPHIWINNNRQKINTININAVDYTNDCLQNIRFSILFCYLIQLLNNMSFRFFLSLFLLYSSYYGFLCTIYTTTLCNTQ